MGLGMPIIPIGTSNVCNAVTRKGPSSVLKGIGARWQSCFHWGKVLWMKANLCGKQRSGQSSSDTGPLAHAVYSPQYGVDWLCRVSAPFRHQQAAK